MRFKSCHHCGIRPRTDLGDYLLWIETPAGRRLLCFKCRQPGLPLWTTTNHAQPLKRSAGGG